MKLLILFVLAVVIFPPAPGDTAVWGRALPDETVCVKVEGQDVSCTIANESGFFGVYPLAPLAVGSLVIAWGTYSGASEARVLYRFYLEVVMK